MGLFKTDEEKAAEQAAKDAENAARAKAAAEQQAKVQEQRQQAAFLSSPVGKATAAKRAGQAFFEVQLEVGRHERTASWGAEHEVSSQVATAAGVLGDIERVGWRLEHVGYVYMITGEASTNRVLLSGEQTAVSGRMMGIYLFRSVDSDSSAASSAASAPLT